jgi:translation initiation factor 4E
MNEYSKISLYLNEPIDTIRNNLVNELILYRDKYLQYFNDIFLFDEYVQNIKDDDTFWDYIIPIACSYYYNINIGISTEMHVFINDSLPVHLYLYEQKKDKEEHSNQEESNQEEQPKQDKDKLITVFDDPINFNCKHPFSNAWDLWIDNKNVKPKSDNWLDTIKKIVSFDSIEDFWSVFNNIPSASNLNVPADYYLFKENIIPCWEDTLNKTGGKMTIVLKKQKDCVNYELLDKIWNNTVLGTIGNTFESDIITGLVLNIRKHQDRINIWTSSSDEHSIIELGNKWKDILNLNNFEYYISFIKHDDNSINYIIT